ncbi:MAG: serine/threonine-protein phosphatase, partial [Candidatus Cloacimonetes bacterium]|nr:serine/threonine-protein phosphatase [Candidatus Cloacimonadota bacterium]
KIKLAFLSKKGNKAFVNQDSFAVPKSKHDTKNKGWFFVVCDGVGGYIGGEIASKMCCETMMDNYYKSDNIEDIPNWLEDEIKKINNQIIAKGINNGTPGMSTTMISLLIKDNTAYINNVGDSRVYQFSDKTLKQITEDHSVVWGYYKQGLITKDEIIKSSIKHLITEGLGLNSRPKINSYQIKLPDKFLFLLCTDGLTDIAIDKEIEKIIKETEDLQTCVEHLYKLSQDNYSLDDVTMVVVKN